MLGGRNALFVVHSTSVLVSSFDFVVQIALSYVLMWLWKYAVVHILSIKVFHLFPTFGRSFK